MYKIYTIIHVHGNYTSLLITGIYNIQFWTSLTNIFPLHGRVVQNVLFLMKITSLEGTISAIRDKSMTRVSLETSWQVWGTALQVMVYLWTRYIIPLSFHVHEQFEAFNIQCEILQKRKIEANEGGWFSSLIEFPL